MMNILLKTRFMRGIVEKIIEKNVKKSTGCDIKAHLGDLNITHNDGKPVVLHLDIFVEMNEESIKELLEGLKVI